jgi:hypothetical protein
MQLAQGPLHHSTVQYSTLQGSTGQCITEHPLAGKETTCHQGALGSLVSAAAPRCAHRAVHRPAHVKDPAC